MTPMEEALGRLEAERYGPIVRDPGHIPHIPLAAYSLDELLEIAAEEEREEQELAELRRLDAATCARVSRHLQRRERILSEDEIEAAP